ncbi:MAG: glycolate oxidase subunit GlcF [Alphaproteobacteria bacterium]|nr:glycolate oxidase subunit GlcF [Alphaproteobacteria bacterium]
MQTHFSLAQLADPDIAEANAILRACVHCGFCTATCPTYTLLGDELDSPRGRIYQIKDMLERNIPAPVETVKHIDRCLSCLSCMTTCPSGVHYMHLVDHARAYIEQTHTRPLMDRAIRLLLAFVLPKPFLFRIALIGASLAKPLARFLPGRLSTILALAPVSVSPPSQVDQPQTFAAAGERRARVALMNGCAQQVLAPEINEASIRLLNRLGVEVVVAKGSGCCGALVHHMGRTDDSHNQAAGNIRAWRREMDLGGLDAIIVNTSGCGTTVKDYGFMFRQDAALKADAARVSDLAKDIIEFLVTLDLSAAKSSEALKVAYHSACSMQHGQKITDLPKELLGDAGFDILTPAEGHLCCGSAGTYNLLQPEIATRLRDRKVGHIEATAPDVIAAGNIGCMTQISAGTDLPVVHTVELLDWATGGPKPAALATRHS